MVYSLGYKIELIGFDSMGSRGMATVIEIQGCKIFIDPGVSYAPRRYGLPPHPLELEVFNKHLNQIYKEVEDTTHIVISHYHRDHYLYRSGEEEYYKDKILYIKDPENNINVSQRIRAYNLLRKRGVDKLAKELNIADGAKYYIDENILLEFSPPVPHGKNGTPLGFVVMTYIYTDEVSILHASDVQGPLHDYTKNYIIEKDPEILIISGPPTYFEGYRLDTKDIEKAIKSLIDIIDNTVNLNTIILDHHLLRDLEYRYKMKQLFDYVNSVKKVRVVTAAEFMGLPIRQLEALRRRLWEEK